jgi:group I intron endonuclease
MKIYKIKMKHYVYLTTNLITGKQYVGDHSSNKVDDTYFGSGKYIKDAIKKYGKSNFNKIILEYFDTKQQAFIEQEKYIKKYNTLAPNGYNISPTGGHQAINSVSEETKEKMKAAAKKRKPQSEETKQKRRNSLKGHKVTDETKEKIIRNNKGKKRSIETCKNIKLSKQNISQETKNKIQTNTKLALQRLDVKEKMKIAAKGRVPWNKHIIYEELVCPYCNKKMKKSSNYTRYHNENCKYNINRTGN